MSTLLTRSNIYNKKYLNMYFCLKRHFRWIHTIIPLQVSDVFIIHPQKILNINAFKLSVLPHNFFLFWLPSKHFFLIFVTPQHISDFNSNNSCIHTAFPFQTIVFCGLNILFFFNQNLLTVWLITSFSFVIS